MKLSNDAEDTFVFTTLPPRLMEQTPSNHPDGWTECLFRGPAGKSVVVNTPGFPQPILRPLKTSFRIENTLSMGLGMFATCNIQMGDLILTERPLTLTPRALTTDVELPVDCTPEEERKIVMAEWEKLLEIVLQRLTPENKATFLSLTNNHKEDDSGPLLSIIRTNGFGVHGLGGSGVENDYSAVYNYISRINHSCCPNAETMFNAPSFSFQLRATRNINEGEQIYISYCEIYPSTDERQLDIAPYGFECTCKACSDPGSDELRRQVAESIKNLPQQCLDWAQDLTFPDDFITRQSKQWLSVMEAGGLQSLEAYRQHLQAIVDVSISLGDIADAVKFGTILGRWILVSTGDQKPLNILAVEDFYKAQSGWGTRPRKRTIPKT